MNTKLIVPVMAAVIGGAAILGASVSSAQAAETPGRSNQAEHQTMAQRLAKRFNLSESDVTGVFQERRTERQAEMTAKLETRLTQAVTDGKITVAQKALILAKHQEMKATRDANQANFRSLSPAEREAHREKMKAELEQWAKANGIDIQFLQPGMGKGTGMHRQVMR